MAIDPGKISSDLVNSSDRTLESWGIMVSKGNPQMAASFRLVKCYNLSKSDNEDIVNMTGFYGGLKPHLWHFSGFLRTFFRFQGGSICAKVELVQGDLQEMHPGKCHGWSSVDFVVCRWIFGQLWKMHEHGPFIYIHLLMVQ